MRGRITRSFTVLRPDGGSVSKPVVSSLMIVGRSRNADLQIDDPLISRRHLEIRVEDNAVFVKDISSQGSMLNGKRLDHEVSLNASDLLEIGHTKLRYEEALDVNAPPIGNHNVSEGV